MIIEELLALVGVRVEGREGLERVRRGLDQTGESVRRFAKIAAAATLSAGTAVLSGAATIGKAAARTGADFENLELRLTALEGSPEKAAAAMDYLGEFAAENGVRLNDAAEAFAKLRTFGIDPTEGALQALVDTAAMSGGGMQDLQGVILAVGQAWSKEKLQQEEALQLIERGVPVWQLLSEKMGLTVAELQDLSSKGELGREAISLLVDAMGERATGAAARYAESFDGLSTAIGAEFELMRKAVADAGYFDWIKEQMSGARDALREFRESGQLDAWAQTVSDGLISIGEGVRSIVDGVRSYFTEISQAESIGEALGITSEKIKAAFESVDWAGIGTVVMAALTAVALDASGIAQNIYGEISTALAGVDWSAAGATIARGLFELASDGAALIRDLIASLATSAGSADWTRVGEAVRAGVLSFTSAVGEFAQGFFDELAVAFSEVDWAALGLTIGEGILAGIKAIGGAIRDYFIGLFQVPEINWSALNPFAGDDEPAVEGARARGGPVHGGKTYLVGEEGPELFTPGASGFVTPNHALPALGVGVASVMDPGLMARFAASAAGATINNNNNSTNFGGVTINAPGGDANSIADAFERRFAENLSRHNRAIGTVAPSPAV